MAVPEMQRRERPGNSPSYPTFSKAHSREAVHSLGQASSSQPDLPTPDSTNVSRSKPIAEGGLQSPKRPTQKTQTNPRAPPSPPLTAEDSEIKRASSGSSTRRTAADTKSNASTRRSAEHDLNRTASGSSMKRMAADAKRSSSRSKSTEHVDDVYPRQHFSASRTSLRDAEEGKSRPKSTSTTTTRPTSTSMKTSFLGSMFKEKGGLASGRKMPLNGSPVKPQSRRRTSGKGSITDSDATSVPDRKASKRPPTLVSNDGDSPPSGGSRPHTPDGRDVPRPPSTRKSTPVVEVFADGGPDNDFDLDIDPYPNVTPAPPPPPPIPLDMAPTEIPRVDYLLQNGGLANTVTKDFSTAANPAPAQPFQQYMSPQVNAPKHIDVTTLFGPYQSLLQSYSSVLAKYGSMAVATGYKSVARRLLDRLENVFARNISSEVCHCVICRASTPPTNDAEHDNGVSWGEVLELVSGRRELPPWPPFSLAGVSSDGLGIRNLENTAAPMQKLDMDVPEEYREHYIRQSKKTKDAVQKWLSSQLPEDNMPAGASSTPPTDVDDGTLTFAMLTYLEPQQRRTFTALLHGLDKIPDSRAPTPATPAGQKQASPNLLSNTARALHRLYRLPCPPRDPECAMFLLNNPTLHCPLATLAAISNGEWEILISGRFDGFLWSGAEDGTSQGSGRTIANSASKVTSRSTTPFSPQSSSSRLQTPTPSGQDRIPGPVQLDEDTEIAVLAEVEREIYLGMEALEDAFEALHSQAETIRIRLRERGAGLALRAANTRNMDNGGGSTMGTPGPNGAAWDRLRSVGAGLGEDDRADVQSIFGGGLLDGRSELAPDDSASNVGWREREKRSRYKKRRPGGDKGAKERRSERRTPAPVEEVDEEEEDPGKKAKSGSERRHRHR